MAAWASVKTVIRSGVEGSARRLVGDLGVGAAGIGTDEVEGGLGRGRRQG